ncbi:MAG: hypothetical protein Q8Q35_04120 [Nanoarchaeota archaeon]|nr:hypothetical protein [Nanoarchaeota archaeon]
MSTQMSLQLSENIHKKAKDYAKKHGFDSLQDFIRDLLRKELFEKNEKIGGLYTMLASEKSLARNWLSKEEDKVWEHLQKEI